MGPFVSRFRTNPVGINQPSVLNTFGGGRIIIRACVGMLGVVLSYRSEIRIGNYAKLGDTPRIPKHDYHVMNSADCCVASNDRQNIKSIPVVLGENVFMGTSAIILKGSRVGVSSSIGAGAVVEGLDISPDSLVKGNSGVIVNVRHGRE